MSDEALVRLFDEFDRGHLSRRQLLQALGVAAVVRPASAMGLPAFGQGSCGPTRAGTPNCNTTPAKLPFEPTGWSTVLLDHFTMRVADYEKEVAYYSTLMNWKLRSDDGKQAMMDIGDFGGVLIIGGYQPPAPPPPPPAPPAPPPDAAGAAGAAGAPAAGRGQGRGGGRGPRTVVWDSFCWGIQPWDAKKVEAELRKRGLDPIADNSGKDFQSFHVKDPDGFDVQISNGSTKNRRTSPAAAKLQVPAPFEATDWKTVWLDHISFQVSDYKGEVAFYTALIGWKGTGDEGSQNETIMCDECGNSLIRGGNSLSPTYTALLVGANLLKAILPSCNLWVRKEFLDQVQFAAEGKSIRRRKMILLVGLRLLDLLVRQGLEMVTYEYPFWGVALIAIGIEWIV